MYVQNNDMSTRLLFLAIRPFSAEGVGVYILKHPARQEVYTPPSFIHPPPPRRVSPRVGGGGYIDVGPVLTVYVLLAMTRESGNLPHQAPTPRIVKEDRL